MSHSQYVVERHDEKKLYLFLLLSALTHIVIFLFFNVVDFSDRSAEEVEWVIDTEIVPDIDVTKAEESVLPDVKQAEKTAVRENMLPQLPKVLQPEIKEVSADDKDVLKVDDKKTEELKKEKEQTKKLEVKPQEKENIPTIDQKDLMKRKALERLKNQQKFADDIQTSKESAIAKLKREKVNDLELNNLKNSLSGSATKKYVTQIKQSISLNYNIPEVYLVNSKELVVVIGMQVDRGGNIASLKVVESSGNAGFDNIILAVVEKSAPLPKPPIGLDKEYILRFDPGSIK